MIRGTKRSCSGNKQESQTNKSASHKVLPNETYQFSSKPAVGGCGFQRTPRHGVMHFEDEAWTPGCRKLQCLLQVSYVSYGLAAAHADLHPRFRKVVGTEGETHLTTLACLQMNPLEPAEIA